MTYTHLTTDELVLIESYYHQKKKGTYVAKQLKRAIDIENSLNNWFKKLPVIYLNQSHSIVVKNFLIGNQSAI